MSRFITNHPQKDLAARLADLIEASQELKFLVGFFYFSGWRELYEPLKKVAESNPNLKLKILVGLSVDRLAGQLVEVARKAEGAEILLEEFAQALSDPSLDLKDFPEQARFFLRLLQEGRLEIRKTREPNHAKLYLFKVDAPQQKLLGSPGKFITGSSNLTHAGLRGQHEFNVEIGDYGFEEAEAYFDDLWEEAVELSPADVARLSEIIERGSLAAQPTPFEVYALLLRRYLEVVEALPARQGPAAYLERLGYQVLPYQLDAVEKILHLLQEYGGAVLADVVGLGKTVVACLVAREYGRRGIVLAPPGLIGEEGRYGWQKYLAEFGLYDWRVYSVGQLEKAWEFVQGPGRDVELVIVDEAHRFRNPDTERYALLQAITAGRKALLLTATPYNNYPLDVFALLRLFLVPGRSKVGPTSDLEEYFRELTGEFKAYSYILRYHKASDPGKREKAERLYKTYFHRDPPVDEEQVKRKMSEVAQRVRLVMAPVTVRRNRLDLERDPRYREHLPAFSRLEDPKPLFYELSPEQSAFYDRVVGEWFGPEGAFRGAIYQPALYQEGLLGQEESEEGSAGEAFVLESQRNLADFMRRLLVRRFESSFGAFVRTVDRLIRVHEQVLKFARETGYLLLDRKRLEELWERVAAEEPLEVEEWMEALLQEGRSQGIYRLDDFKAKELFLVHAERDLALLKEVREEIEALRLSQVEEDPKAQALAQFLRERLEAELGRKLVVFSEFVDTVEHLEEYLKGKGFRVLAVGRKLNGRLVEKVVLNFDASVPEERRHDDYDILVTSDKLSEGVNLHRAGAVINYDIPWNPTRVIQRVGRIHRIGQKKVFDTLHIYHFFPTEKGSRVVDSRKVAEHKLFLIHQALGEDAKVLSPNEEPSPARIYERLTQLPEEEESFDTWVRREWERVKELATDIEARIARLPNRVKTAKSGEGEHEVLLVVRKGLAFYAFLGRQGSLEASPLFFPEALSWAKAEPNTPSLPLSEEFWQVYKDLEKAALQGRPKPLPPTLLEQKVIHNLNTALNELYKEESEMKAFIKALRDEIKQYKRLPRYVLRRLVEVDLGDRARPEFPQIKAKFEEVLKEIERRFGRIVLEKPKVASVPELVVAVEKRPDPPSSSG